MEIKLLIADDHRLFRESLSSLFNDPDIKIIDLAEDGHDAIAKARELLPNIILMDISMGEMDGIEATKRLRKEQPDIKIIGLSMHTDKSYIKEMLEAGAHGYLLKDCSYKELVGAIKTVYKGNKYLMAEVTKVVVDDLLFHNGDTADADKELTKRELEVFKLYANGLSTRDISEKLFISVKTTGTHKQNILKKLDLKTTADMIKYGIKHGMVHVD
jgi:two-component system, NarL family, response regulator NreC